MEFFVVVVWMLGDGRNTRERGRGRWKVPRRLDRCKQGISDACTLVYIHVSR